jgi:hypothetical protein
MAGQAKHTSRNRKIEPLDWAEAANSPALKGMMSFLDIKPEEVRSGHFKDVPDGPDLRIDPIGDSLTGSDTLIATIEEKPIAPKAVIEMRPKRVSAATSLPVSPELPPVNDAPPVSDPLPVSDSLPDSDPLPVSVSHPVRDTLPVSESSPVAINVVRGSVPSQNRKIRKCRLSQDAHSAGEETLYRILWEEGKPMSANPLGSRTVRIGYAELANRARMHKANVRLNLASLAAKLAIEQSGDFSSRDMIAKSYRVLSYKEILERRRAAGLEYVIRQKNVIFVTPTGVPIELPGLPQAKKGKKNPAYDTQPVSDAPPVGESLPDSDTRTGSENGLDLQADDMACVSKAMNTYWTVDDAATDQLIRACRKIRPDAEAEEIAYFVREKLELTRTNRNITNPIGLILATVPQSFSGYSFDTFRQRRQESKRLAEEERLRKEEDDRRMRVWMVRHARETLANPKTTDKQRKEAEAIIDLYSQPETESNPSPAIHDATL